MWGLFFHRNHRLVKNHTEPACYGAYDACTARPLPISLVLTVGGNMTHSPALLRSYHPTIQLLIFVALLLAGLAIIMFLRSDQTTTSKAVLQGSAAADTLPVVNTQTSGTPTAIDTAPSGTSQTTVTVNSSSSTNADGTVSTDLTVNGQPVDIPINGNSQQTITSPDGQSTTVNTSGSQTTTGTGTNSSHTSTHLSIHSSTHSIQQGGSTP